MLAALLVSTWVQAGEEVGWRGYLLPSLARRLGLGGATLVVGIIWAVWHLPLFFIPGSGSDGQSFPLYLAHVTALSVAMGWLYWKSAGSLLVVMVMHAAINNTGSLVPGVPAFAGRGLLLARFAGRLGDSLGRLGRGHRLAGRDARRAIRGDHGDVATSGDRGRAVQPGGTGMKRTTPSVEAYLAALPANARSQVSKVRRAIRQAAPGVEERISYQSRPSSSARSI